jgi:hypothetical protein
MATARWDGADHERALAAATTGAGWALVPAPLSARVIDLARNRTVVLQAGAQTVPMTGQTLALARLTSEGSPAWKTENAAITAADMAFDRVTSPPERSFGSLPCRWSCSRTPTRPARTSSPGRSPARWPSSSTGGAARNRDRARAARRAPSVRHHVDRPRRRRDRNLGLRWVVSVDASVIGAHQHAAGARKRPARAEPTGDRGRAG